MIPREVVSELVELKFLLEELVELLPVSLTIRESVLEVLEAAVEEVLEGELEDEENVEDALDLVDALSELADRLLAVDLLLPGLPGRILEMYDGPAIEAAIRALVELFTRDPEVVALRRERRLERRKARLERRRLRQLVRTDRRKERRALRDERRELRRSKGS